MEIDFSRFSLSRLIDRFFDVDTILDWIDLIPEALWRTIQVSLVAEGVGIAVGLLIALGAIHRRRTTRALFRSYIEVWRGTPLLVQILFIHFSLPLIGIRFEPFMSGVVTLSLNSSAYVAEIFRAGIVSVERGQVEAARSLGMSYRQALRHVILPQAFRRVVPPLTNEFVALIKDSSLVSIVGLLELVEVARRSAGATFDSSMYPVVAAVYLSLTLPLTFLSRRLELRLARRGALTWLEAEQVRRMSLYLTSELRP